MTKKKKVSRAGASPAKSTARATAPAAPARARRGTVQLAYSSGARHTVKAALIGEYFAVHQAVHSSGAPLDHYTVTHVPSGAACGIGFKQKAVAFGAARALAAANVNWNFTDPMKLSKRGRGIGGRIVYEHGGY